MYYIVEPIGSVFATKNLAGLAESFSAKVPNGYRLHSVFEVTQPAGCALFGQPTRTYLAIYEAISLTLPVAK